MLYTGIPVPPHAHIPLSLMAGRSSLGSREILLHQEETDLGDVLAQVHYGVARFHLNEAMGQRDEGMLWLRVRDNRGDVYGSESVQPRLIDLKELTLSVALPEGEWQLEFTAGDGKRSYTPDRPVVIGYSEPVIEYTLIASADGGHGPKKESAASDPRAELEKLGVPYTEASFIERIERGNLNAVRLFLRAGMNPNSKRGDGTPGLLIAASYHSDGIVEALLDGGASVTAAGPDGLTVLAVAAKSYGPDLVRVVLEKGANVNARDESGSTPLMAAVQSHYAPTIELLLGAGADINAADNEGRTALSYAIDSGDREILGMLLERGANIKSRDKEGKTPLMKAAEKGSVPCVALLLAAGAATDDKDNEGWTALALAISRGNSGTADMLRRAGATESLDVAMMEAVRLGETDRVVSLLKRGANPNATDVYRQTLLMIAAGSNYNDVVDALLASGADANLKDPVSNKTALMEAARKGNSPIVRALLVVGAEINARNIAGESALMLAASNGQVGVVRVLLEKGADVRATDNKGRTALEIAEWSKQAAVAELLKSRELKK
ncbi:MAG TPA: ankyrin repeat domain-containing protein [Blastocatellia bacterium]|nr:ankyrin repeat domain-containing protein [Blastocatellia bacterium]